MVPNKIVTFRRWEIALAFIVLTIVFTVMGVLLNNQNNKVERQNKVLKYQVKNNEKALRLVQISRTEACEQNYKDVEGIINLFVEEEKAEKGGKLSKDITLLVLKYYRTHPMECNFS